MTGVIIGSNGLAFFVPFVLAVGVLSSPRVKQGVKDCLNNRWIFRILLIIVLWLLYFAYSVGTD